MIIDDMILGISFWMFWLIVAAVLVIIEILTSSVFALCIAVGALGAFVAAIAGAGVEMQLIVLAVVMIISFVAIPPLKRHYNSRECPVPETMSNMDAMLGRVACICSEPTEYSLGRVLIDGVSWQVRSAGGEPLPVGRQVEVVGHDSIILIVKPL